MTLTNEKAFESYELLVSLGNETGKLGFAIMKNVRKLGTELEEFMAKRNELFKKYGTEEDGVYTVPAEKVPAFLEEYKTYSEIEMEFQPHLIDEDVFCSGGLTSEQMLTLEWMVKEEE